MAKFKLNVSEPKTGKTSTSELEGPKAKPLLGRAIGETVDGSTIGISGKTVYHNEVTSMVEEKNR